MPVRHVAIVGGGASGALVAINALRLGGPSLRVEAIEPTPEIGRGIAYGTTADEHLLNVPASGMSAFPDEPNHFLEWASVDEGVFVPRHSYGTYLQELLSTSIGTSKASFAHRQSRATRIGTTRSRLSVELDEDRKSTRLNSSH